MAYAPRGLKLKDDERELLASAGVGYVYTDHDKILADRQLSPLSKYPLCDFCGKPSGQGLRWQCGSHGRYWAHDHCVQQRLNTGSRLDWSPFPQWLHRMPPEMLEALRTGRQAGTLYSLQGWLVGWLRMGKR